MSNFKKSSLLFNNKLPFHINSISSSINTNTTDTLTLKCKNWKLTKEQINHIIKNSEPIGGTEWDLRFLVLSCIKSVTISQNEQEYHVEINAGSFFTINNRDTTLLYGDYKKYDRKYFIEAPSNF